jgi:hypothetical protein
MTLKPSSVQRRYEPFSPSSSSVEPLPGFWNGPGREPRGEGVAGARTVEGAVLVRLVLRPPARLAIGGAERGAGPSARGRGHPRPAANNQVVSRDEHLEFDGARPRRQPANLRGSTWPSVSADEVTPHPTRRRAAGDRPTRTHTTARIASTTTAPAIRLLGRARRLPDHARWR